MAKKNKKLISGIIIVILGLCGLASGIMATVSGIKKKNNERSVRVAFYGLSEEYVKILEEKIPREEKVILKCDVLSEANLDLAALKQKYDMLFTWQGEITDRLEPASLEIPSKILEQIPTSLRNKKCIPILLDNYELAYNKAVVENTTETLPVSFSAFLKYLNQAKSQVFVPFLCAGGDDRTLAAFVGSLVMANGGLEAYNSLIEELKAGSDFNVLLKKELGPAKISLEAVLQMLKNWKEEEVTNPTWYNAQKNDVIYYAHDDHLGVFFTSLGEHRKIPYETISKFESLILPPVSSTTEFGIIAPAISCMLLSDNANCKRYLAEFFTAEVQKELSDKTKLAPTQLRAQAYDRQADDVRYWAASCSAGALPDLYLAAFQRRPEKLVEFAKDIRNVVK